MSKIKTDLSKFGDVAKNDIRDYVATPSKDYDERTKQLKLIVNEAKVIREMNADEANQSIQNQRLRMDIQSRKHQENLDDKKFKEDCSRAKIDQKNKSEELKLKKEDQKNRTSNEKKRLALDEKKTNSDITSKELEDKIRVLDLEFRKGQAKWSTILAVAGLVVQVFGILLSAALTFITMWLAHRQFKALLHLEYKEHGIPNAQMKEVHKFFTNALKK